MPEFVGIAIAVGTLVIIVAYRLGYRRGERDACCRELPY